MSHSGFKVITVKEDIYKKLAEVSKN